ATMKSAMRNTSVAQSARPNCGVSGVHQHSRPATVYHYNDRSTVKANARHNVLLTLTAILSESDQGAELGQSNVFMAFEVDHNRHTDADVFIRDLDDIRRQTRSFFEFDDGDVVRGFRRPASLVLLVHDAE